MLSRLAASVNTTTCAASPCTVARPVTRSSTGWSPPSRSYTGSCTCTPGASGSARSTRSQLAASKNGVASSVSSGTPGNPSGASDPFTRRPA